MRRSVRILVVGAGEAGRGAVAEMRAHPEYGATPVAYVDDNPALHGTSVDGLPVLGGRETLAGAADESAADEILIAIPSASGSIVRAMVRAAESTRRPVRIVPGLREIILGDVRIEQIRRIRPEDLLGREHTAFDDAPARTIVEGARVLVTGAGGSIGADLCRQILAMRPAALTLLGRGENSIYEIETELRAHGVAAPLEPIIADVRDRARMQQVLAAARPQVVFHAAAHKHVHYMERFPEEALRVNVVGTQNVAEAARAAGCERFVMLSTDKAVHPTGVMGLSKRLAELVLQEMHAEGGGTRFVAVRFGNVLASRGSVVPLFLRQIERGGPVTVSDPRATRYFMTIREASSLVLAAASVGRGGEVFVLDMGEPINIAELARDLIALTRPEQDHAIEVHFTGLRPGEKLTESLWEDDEDVRPTDHPGIRVLTAPVRLGDIRARVAALARTADALDAASVARGLAEVVDAARPSAV